MLPPETALDTGAAFPYNEDGPKHRGRAPQHANRTFAAHREE